MPATEFLNVDLDVYSRKDLTPLVEAFGEINLHHGRIGRLDHASFEVLPTLSPEATVRRLLRQVHKLRGAARALWAGAVRRDFNIGIGAGVEPHSFELELSAEAVRGIAEVKGRVVVTVYAPDPGAEVAPRARAK